jgi:hypothetical protein
MNFQKNRISIFNKYPLLQVLRNYTINHIEAVIICVLFAMFVLGYTESLRWPLGVPKATHGFLKGLMILLCLSIPLIHKFLKKVSKPTEIILTSIFVISFLLSAMFTIDTGAAILY